MRFFPFYLFLSLPLTGLSQDLPSAIIVEDEDAELTPSNFLDFVKDSEEPSTETDSVEPVDENIATSENKNIINPALAEQPDDLHLPLPEEAVIVKIEMPKSIQLSEAHAKDFQLLTPWAPKPMQKAPKGWRYIPASEQEAYPVSVTLATGKNLSLKVTPYTLVPEISNRVIQAREPGYQPELGYQQEHSVSARLRTTIHNLETAGNSLDQSIDNLSALVDSLPK